MSLTTNVANIIPGVQAIGVLGMSASAIPKNMGWGSTEAQQKKDMKKFMRASIGTLVAIPVVGATAQQVSTL